MMLIVILSHRSPVAHPTDSVTDMLEATTWCGITRAWISNYTLPDGIRSEDIPWDICQACLDARGVEKVGT